MARKYSSRMTLPRLRSTLKTWVPLFSGHSKPLTARDSFMSESPPVGRLDAQGIVHRDARIQNLQALLGSGTRSKAHDEILAAEPAVEIGS